jgi:hypothetical protein
MTAERLDDNALRALRNSDAYRNFVMQSPFAMDILILDTLQIDWRYQRDLDEKRLRVLTPYSRAYAGAMEVNVRPDGTYWVMDGQHRGEAARRALEELATCLLFRYLTWQEEAMHFYIKNSTAKKTDALQEWKARVPNDPDAQHVEAILARYGYTVGINRGRQAGTITAIQTIEGMSFAFAKSGKRAGRNGPVVGPRPRDWPRLERLVALVHSAWPGSVGAIQAVVLEGIDMFLRVYAGQYDPERLAFQLRAHDPRHLRERSQAKAKSTSYPSSTLLAIEVLVTYNKGLSSRRLPDLLTPLAVSGKKG